jgi:hypothetical protein
MYIVCILDFDMLHKLFLIVITPYAVNNFILNLFRAQLCACVFPSYWSLPHCYVKSFEFSPFGVFVFFEDFLLAVKMSKTCLLSRLWALLFSPLCRGSYATTSLSDGGGSVALEAKFSDTALIFSMFLGYLEVI